MTYNQVNCVMFFIFVFTTKIDKWILHFFTAFNEYLNGLRYMPLVLEYLITILENLLFFIPAYLKTVLDPVSNCVSCIFVLSEILIK